MARRRSFFLNAFGLSFLDVMSCGLGAAVLIFLLVDYRLTEAAESDGLDAPQLKQRVAAADAKTRAHHRQAKQLERELRELGAQRTAAVRTRAELQADRPEAADTKALIERLRASEREVAEARAGRQMLERVLEARRQYAAGFRVEGRRILVLVDRSASMTDRRIADAVRNKYLPDEQRREAAKWRWTRSILEWLLAHLPADAQYQVFGYADEARPAAGGGWLDASDEDTMEQVREAVHRWVPDGGTRLDRALAAARKMEPAPDAVYLLTDGLPTRGKSWFKRAKVSPAKRQEFFEEAVAGARDPAHHVILLPLEGDPNAAGLYWRFAMRTGGQFLAPAEDWP